MQYRAGFPNKDMALIGGSGYQGYIYVGTGDTTKERITAAHNPVIESSYCISGSYSTATCGHVVLSLDGSFCDDGTCTPDSIVSTIGWTTEDGDSGAPFFQPDGSTDKIRGMHYASGGTYEYAHKWSTIRDTFDVTIVTQ